MAVCGIAMSMISGGMRIPISVRASKSGPLVFACPSDPARPISEVYVPVLAATTSYALVQGSLGPDAPLPVSKFENDGLFIYVEQRAPRQVTDGLSQTLATGEVVLADTWESSNTWSYALVHADCLRSTRNPLNTIPGDGVVRERQNGAFGSHHAGGAIFGYADSHVAWLSDGRRSSRLPVALHHSRTKRGRLARGAPAVLGPPQRIRLHYDGDFPMPRWRVVRWFWLVGLCLPSTWIGIPSAGAQPASLILVNAQAYTQDAHQPIVDTICIRDGRIVRHRRLVIAGRISRGGNARPGRGRPLRSPRF